jgi:hypothetical protein
MGFSTGHGEEIERLTLNDSGIDYIVMQSELKNLIGVQQVGLDRQVLMWKPNNKQRSKMLKSLNQLQ